MKELFREQDFSLVGHYQSILETAGIRTLVRNQDLTMSGLAELPIPEFFPALCVVDDDDYERAMEVIRDHLQADQERSAEEVRCVHCGETSPGNFEICWACGEAVRGESPDGR